MNIGIFPTIAQRLPYNLFISNYQNSVNINYASFLVHPTIFMYSELAFFQEYIADD